jgi:formylmethanofuran dehydrogenase subunit E
MSDPKINPPELHDKELQGRLQEAGSFSGRKHFKIAELGQQALTKMEELKMEVERVMRSRANTEHTKKTSEPGKEQHGR